MATGTAKATAKGEVTDRRRARHEATKARILDAAWDLAREQGLAGISLRDLAARVDLRQPSLYSYFDSKMALYDAMFAQGYRQLLDATADLEPQGTPLEHIGFMARVFVDLSLAEPVRAQLLFQRPIPGFEPSPESYALAQEFYERTRERFVAAGLDTDHDLDLYTALTAGIVSQQLANDPGGTRWTRLVDEMMDMYLAHVAANGRAVG
jgi:AcrR family transcriptional regulator